MSEVQVKEQGGNKKARQKKQTLRVDFTPMVDMNMLLITFFMFATTLLKPQVMNIAMPSTEKPPPGKKQIEVRESAALTIIMGQNDNLYYYEGMPTEELYKDTAFLKKGEYGQDGIRQILLRKNRGTFDKIQELKLKRERGEIDIVLYDSIAKMIQNEANEKANEFGLFAPNIFIKPTDKSSYKNMVDILDEMLICNIGFYQIVELSDGDRYLYYMRTGDPDILSPAQKAQIDKIGKK